MLWVTLPIVLKDVLIKKLRMLSNGCIELTAFYQSCGLIELVQLGLQNQQE